MNANAHARFVLVFILNVIVKNSHENNAARRSTRKAFQHRRI
jgi:hypothetical protein